MQRLERAELIRLRRAVMRSRTAVSEAREELIQSLGDWICGGGSAPSLDAVKALADLYQVKEEAEASYARCIAVFSEGVLARARRGAH